MLLTIYGTVKQDRESDTVFEFSGTREVTDAECKAMAQQTLVISLAGGLRKVLDNPTKLNEYCKKNGITIGKYVPEVKTTKKVDVSKLTVAELEELLARKVAEQAQ